MFSAPQGLCDGQRAGVCHAFSAKANERFIVALSFNPNTMRDFVALLAGGLDVLAQLFKVFAWGDVPEVD